MYSQPMRNNSADENGIDRVLSTIEHSLMVQGPVRPGNQLLVALSGGADSTALLIGCHELSSRYGLSLAAAHVNYRVRGEESDRDEASCRDLANRLQVSCHVLQSPPPVKRPTRWNLQSWARAQRYDYCDMLARRHGYDWILTGHQADDQVETVTRAFIDGRGSFALTGIPERRGLILRPLLSLHRGELTTFLRSRGVNWMEDRSNASNAYRRNELRNQIIPLIENVAHGDFRKSVLRLQRHMINWRTLLENLADRLVDDAQHKLSKGLIVLDYGKLAGYDRGLAPFVLRAILKKIDCGTPPSDDAVERFMRMTQEDGMGRRFWSGAFRMERIKGTLVVSTSPPANGRPAVLDSLGESHFSDWGLAICSEFIDQVSLDSPTSDNESEAFFDADALHGSLTLRSAATRDRYRPFGLGGSRTVGRALAEAGLPTDWRPWAPTIYDRQGVIWPVGAPIADRVKVTSNTRRIRHLRLEWN